MTNRRVGPAVAAGVLALCIVVADCGGSDKKSGAAAGDQPTATTTTEAGTAPVIGGAPTTFPPATDSAGSGAGDGTVDPPQGAALDPGLCDVVSADEVAQVVGGKVRGDIKCSFDLEGNTKVGRVDATDYKTVTFSRPPSDQWTELTTKQMGRATVPLSVGGVGDEAYLVFDAANNGKTVGASIFFGKAGEHYQVDIVFPADTAKSGQGIGAIRDVLIGLAKLRLSKAT